MRFEVMGHEDRYCGSMINVHWGSKDDPPSKLNKNYSGIYLVKSITHYFDPYLYPSFRQKLMCIKNGYKDSDLNELENAVKKRLG
jgi:hypothetical protein